MSNNDDEGSGYESDDVPWQGRSSLEQPPPPSSSEILQRHLEASQAKALAIVAPINRIVEATLDALDRYENVWTVALNTPFDAYYTSIPERARGMFPEETRMARVCERMWEVEAMLARNSSSNIIRELEGGSVYRRCHRLIETLRRARTALSCVVETLGDTVVKVQVHEGVDGGGWYETAIAQLETATPPPPAAMQRAREGILCFVNATGRHANGSVDQWESKARAVRALEDCLRETIAEFPQQFGLFDKAANRLSSCRVWWRGEAEGPIHIPWTRLLSPKYSGYEKNLGVIMTKTNPLMVRMIRRLIEKGLY